MNYISMSFFFLIFLMVLTLIVFLLAFISKRKHLLATLLSLEGMMLIILLSFFFIFSSMGFSVSYVVALLTLAACEGALGLSLLVCMIRNYGSDQFNSLNFLQC